MMALGDIFAYSNSSLYQYVGRDIQQTVAVSGKTSRYITNQPRQVSFPVLLGSELSSGLPGWG